MILSLSIINLSIENIEKYEIKFQTDKLIVGSKLPCSCYLRFPMDRIYNYNKNLKLIIILREPISRAYSEYNMYFDWDKDKKLKYKDGESDEVIFDYFKKMENEQLCELTKVGPNNIVRGYYDEILQYILSKFPRENLYIGISEEISKNKIKY